MRRVTAALVLLAVLASTLATPTARADVAAGATPTAAALATGRRGALVERGIGWGLAGVGFATLACAGVLIGSSMAGDVDFAEGGRNFTGGFIALAAGLGLLVPGLVLSVRGQARLQEIEHFRHVLFGAAPTPGGFTVAARLTF